MDKSNVDKELARRLCAAFLSRRLGITVATQYKNTPEDVGDLWYFLADLAEKLFMEQQSALFSELQEMAVKGKLIQ